MNVPEVAIFQGPVPLALAGKPGFGNKPPF